MTGHPPNGAPGPEKSSTKTGQTVARGWGCMQRRRQGGRGKGPKGAHRGWCSAGKRVNGERNWVDVLAPVRVCKVSLGVACWCTPRGVISLRSKPGDQKLGTTKWQTRPRGKTNLEVRTSPSAREHAPRKRTERTHTDTEHEHVDARTAQMQQIACIMQARAGVIVCNGASTSTHTLLQEQCVHQHEAGTSTCSIGAMSTL